MKAHELIQVFRSYDGGAMIMRYGKPAKHLTEAQAKRIDKLLLDDRCFRRVFAIGGGTYLKLSDAERRKRIARNKRNAQRRELAALGAFRHGGWASHWQRR